MAEKDYFNGVRIDFIRFMDSTAVIEGCVDYGVLKDDENLLFVTSDNLSLKPEFVARAQRSREVSDGSRYDGGGFKVTVPLAGEDGVISARVASRESVRPVDILPQEFTRLSEVASSYFRYGEVLCRRKGRSSIQIKPYKKSLHIRYEINFLLSILFYWRLANAKAAFLGGLRDGGSLKRRIFNFVKPVLIIGEMIVKIPRAYYLRVVYLISKPRIKRPIWLISDRGMSAGDNGEALFRYIIDQPDCPADVFFVLSKKSKDYDRLSQIGPVLNQDSMRYKRLFLLADKVISSQADVEVTNPFLRQKNHFVDLYTFDFVFLQHGIIRHDLSGWLNRYNKNIRLFITSAEVEYNSIINGNYYYDEENVLLSGLPRYDLLENDPKSKLILAPTYRKELVRLDTDKNGARPYDPEFIQSEYRDYYNNLMNDERVLDILRKNNMTGELYLHPVFESQIKDFNTNEVFTAKSFPYDYKTAFREGSIMVTDYSSVVFDFAYLKKPVVYSQFDKKRFFEHHMYQESDFFSDERDGFGPIATSYDEAIDRIIETIESGCEMSKKYQKRAESFFFKNDRSNSERVYEAILSL